MPQIDVRRHAARRAAAVLALQPPRASVECAAWPARQSRMVGEQIYRNLIGTSMQVLTAGGLPTSARSAEEDR